MSNHKDTAILVGVAAVTIVGLYLFFKKQVSDGAGALGAAIDPTNEKNVFHTFVNKVGATATGNNNFSLGSAIYDALHPNQPDLTAPVKVAPRKVLAAAKPKPKKAGVA